MPGNCFLKTCSFKSNVTPPKTNIHTKNDGLEDVSPFKHGYIFWVSMLLFGGVSFVKSIVSSAFNVRFRDDFQGKDLPIEIIEVHDVKPSKGGSLI